MNYIINVDESTVVDQLLYHAYQRIGYNITMDAMPMGYAIQMANSGERDALGVQNPSILAQNENLVMIPEQLCDVAFQAFIREGSDIDVRSWEDLSGLMVGHLFQKTYIINHLPEDITGSIQRETFYELNLALLAGECDVVVTTSTLDQQLVTMDGVVYLSTVDLAPCYTFLNKKYESLVPEVSKSLIDMKRDGSYERIVNGEWKPEGYGSSVLHISSFYAEDSWDAALMEGITASLNGSGVSYYNVPLYSNRFVSEYEQAKNAYYSIRTMMMSHPPDVIIASDRSAVSFVCNYYYTLFKDIPVIIYDFDDGLDLLWLLGGNYAALYETMPAAETATVIQQLFPETDRLFVINDYTENGAVWRANIEEVLGNRFKGMDVYYNENATHQELIDEIAALPESAAILLGHYMSDSDELFHSRPQADSLIMANTALPVFGLKYGNIGSGQIGGKYVDPISRGAAIGKYALDMIAKRPDLPAFIAESREYGRWIFDEEVLTSRNIDIRDIPSDAEIINHRYTISESNPEAFNMMILAGILSGLLIAGLSYFLIVIQRKNRSLYETQKSLHTAEELKATADSANKAKTDFLAKMSHEIRTPINAILGVSEIALREIDDHAVNEHISTIYQAGTSLLTIINDILDFSKIESGKMQIISDEYSVSSLINSVIGLIRIRLVNSQIRFIVKVDKNIPRALYGDEARIRQAVLNILNNAVKYTEKGFVSLEVNTEFIDGDTVNITFKVKDSGMGIKQEDKDQLFDEFTQFNLDKNISAEGVGLGLAITYGIVEAMNGTIGVESEYGKGSDFTVTLPQKYQSREPLAAVEQAERKSVLVFDQRGKYAESLTYTLGDLGVDCTLVTSGTDLYETLERRSFDFLFIPHTLYVKNEDTIEKFCKDSEIVILSEFGEVIPVRNMSVLVMPTYCAYIADVLNGTYNNSSYSADINTVIGFSAPNASVLVVDDINTNLSVAQGLLLPYKMRVELCNGGMEAIEFMKNERYDLVFMDHKMPGMDGVETVRRIRAMGETDAYYKDVPIIAFTANAVSGMVEMFMENGFNDFLDKPIDSMKLNNILQKWIPEHLRE